MTAGRRLAAIIVGYLRLMGRTRRGQRGRCVRIGAHEGRQ
jgi:hypothetical protein